MFPLLQAHSQIFNVHALLLENTIALALRYSIHDVLEIIDKMLLFVYE